MPGNKTIKINNLIGNDFFQVIVNDKYHYSVNYPHHVWAVFNNKANLASNYTYARLAPLPLAVKKQVIYNFGQSALYKIITSGVLGDLGRISFVNKIKVASLIAGFKKRQEKFVQPSDKQKILPHKKTSPAKMILALSFGKDSLLSYALLKELNYDFQIMNVNEMEKEYRAENQYKREIIAAFLKEQKEKIITIEDDVDSIYYNDKLGIKIEEFDNANGMLAFALEVMPLNYYYGAKYLVLGNERNFVDTWVQDGYRSHPSFDQTPQYAQRLNYYLKNLTNSNYQVISLIEPLYNLAEMKILNSRYPHLLKYMMSCSVEKNARDKWCYECPMCAKSFLYTIAVGGDLKKIGFSQDLLAKRYKNLYPIFATRISRANEMPSAVKEEELLAFLLAHHQGWRGDLMNDFKRRYLKEAIKNEKKWRAKFFKVHPAVNIPAKVKGKLLNIFHQELKSFL